MTRSPISRFAAIIMVGSLLLAFPGVASATIRGGCTGTGTATSGGVDLTTAAEWRVRSTDVGGGTGTSPTPVKSASVAAYAAGIPIPIASGTDEEGETTGSVSGVSVSTFASLGARFTVAGSADNGCSGEITIIIDDVNPLFTALGGGGLIAVILGLLALLLAARSGGWGSRMVAFVFGALGGLGLGLMLEQFGAIDPTQPISLIIAAVVAIIGLLVAGRFSPTASVA